MYNIYIKKEIKDWYDRDFDVSEHVGQIGKVVLAGVAEVVIMAGVSFIGGPAIVVVAVVAGLNGAATGLKAYNNGKTGSEAEVLGSTSFGVNMATGGLGVYGNSQVAKREVNEIIEQIESGVIDNSADVASKHADDIFEMEIDAEAFEKELDKIANEFTYREVGEISKEVVKSKSQQEVINEIEEYLDDQGLEASSESMELLIAILKDGTK